MDYIDWMIAKLIGVCVLAFIYNFWRAATGQEDQQEQRDK